MADEEATTQDEEQDDFESAFNEIADARAAGEDIPGASDQHSDDDETGAAAEDDADEAAAKAAEAAADDHEGAAAGKDKPAGTTDGGEDEPFKGWPQEAIDRYNAQLEETNNLKHRLQSDAGRVSAFQRKINGLEEQIAKITAGGDDQPTKEDIAAAMSTDEKWDAFKEDYPDIAEAIEGRMTGFKKEVDTTLAPVIEKTQKEAADAEAAAAQESYDKVAEDFPTWQDAVQKQEYRDWFTQQSPGVQALGASVDPRDASMLIGLYDQYRVSNGHTSMRKTDPEPDNGVTTETDELAGRRARQLEDGTTIPSKSARVDPDAESGDDFERAFDAFAARKAEKNRQMA